MKLTTNSKQFFKQYLLPMLYETLIFGALIFAMKMAVRQGPLLQECRLVGSEMSSPTMGRLIYGIASFIGFIFCSILASRYSDDSDDTRPFWFGFTGGVLLWQSAGEIFWHYNVGGINFSPLENITSLPFVIIITMIFVYGKKHHSFDFGVWCVFVTFMCNWLGHYLSIGIYPFFADLVPSRTWNVTCSIVFGGLFLVTSVIYLLYRTRTRRGRALASLFTFISIAIIVFGLLEG